MNILIYEMNINGHRLEYLHHLYMLAMDMPENHFYFVLPEVYLEKKRMFVWPDSSNISIELRPHEDIQPNGRQTFLSLYKSQRVNASILRHYIKKYRIDRIFDLSAIRYFPFLPIFLTKGVKIDGIQYSLFPWAEKNFLIRKLDYAKYFLYKFYSCFENIYTLNDAKSADKLNKFFHTTKFKFLPDPFVPIEYDLNKDYRKKHGISNEKIVFAHFGGLQSRKGTMVIMESLKLLTEEEREKYVFVFAGRVYDEIKHDFYEAYEALKSSVNIIIKDGFCDYEYLASLCAGCNAILIPYLVTNQSSGIIGYASQFGKPVIAPSGGIIGRIVSEYEMGMMLPTIDKFALVDAYQKVTNGLVKAPTDAYCKTNSVKNFTTVIKKGFK